jgi:hypothetical protein
MKYRKKPVVIDAVPVPPATEKGVQWDDFATFMGVGGWEVSEDGGVDILTLEGTMHGNPGDWIIRGVKGELYPCKPEIFVATYEAVA